MTAFLPILLTIVGCIGARSQHEFPADSTGSQDTAAAQDSGAGSPAPSVEAAAGGGGADSGTAAGNDVHASASAPRPEPDARLGSPLGPLDNFHEIAEGRAYRSGQLTAEKLRYVIETKKIKTVVNLRGHNPDSKWYQDEKAACEALGVRLVDVSLSASSLPSKENLLTLYDLFQDSSAEPLLMHCKGGADRSGMVAAMWRREVLGDDQTAAAKELSWRFGHFAASHPEMDEFIRLFEPSRDWIVNEYNPASSGDTNDN